VLGALVLLLSASTKLPAHYWHRQNAAGPWQSFVGSIDELC